MKLREHLHIIRRSIRLLDRLSRRNLLGRSLHALVVALMPYVPIYFSARLIDALIAGAPVQTLALYAGLTIGLTALLSLAKAFLLAQCEIGAPEMELAYEWMHAEKAAQLSYASIEDHEVARLKQRIRSETQTGFNLYYFYSSMERVIQFSVRILVSISLTASFFAADRIALPAKLLFAGGVVLTVAVNMLIGRRSAKIRSAFSADCVQSNIMLGELDGYITDYKPGKDIRLYAMEEPLAALDKRLLDELGAYEMRVYLKCAGLELIATVMNYALRFGVYLLLISGALMGGVTVGSIAQYVSSVMLLLTAAMELVRTAQLLALNDTYTRRFFSYFDIPNPMYKGSLSVEKRDDNEYYIEFCDVTFKYPNTDAYALRHVNLRFRVGEKLAVVGMNGSGKTTFIKLLCRLYDPTEGEIRLNGVDIRKYDYDEYMAIFSVVFQDFQLFAYSLGQNVAASAEYDAKRAEACLREAGFEERLSSMPKGLDTSLYQDFDKNGIEISGGEAQKIAIARALYKNAPFIVLDEPTAALDPVSEYEVYRRFGEISGGKTAIYISHRLASCRFCDEILVFHEGQIVQHGAHEALLAQENGKYAELWNAQAQYYTETA